MSWTFGATTRPWHQLSFEAACESIAEAGYTDVAVFANEGKVPLTADSTPEDAAAVVETTGKYGLKPSMLLCRPSLEGDFAESVAAYKRLIDVCVDAGVHYLMDCGTSRESQYERYYSMMKACAPYAAEKSVELQLKPHGGISLTGDDLVRAHDAVNHPAFTICYDPGNIIYYTKGATRPEPDAHKVATRTTSFIVKDCVVNNGAPDVWILPGSGLVDFESVLGTLVKAGFTGPLYVECLGGDDIDTINRNAKQTHAMLAELMANLDSE